MLIRFMGLAWLLPGVGLGNELERSPLELSALPNIGPEPSPPGPPQ